MNKIFKQIDPDETRIYLFGRTGREKEDWFRRFVIAAGGPLEDGSPSLYDEYMNYMKAQKFFLAEEKEFYKKERGVS